MLPMLGVGGTGISVKSTGVKPLNSPHAHAGGKGKGALLGKGALVRHLLGVLVAHAAAVVALGATARGATTAAALGLLLLLLLATLALAAALALTLAAAATSAVVLTVVVLFLAGRGADAGALGAVVGLLELVAGGRGSLIPTAKVPPGPKPPPPPPTRPWSSRGRERARSLRSAEWAPVPILRRRDCCWPRCWS